MKVYLLQDVEKIGIAGEIIKVKPGYATNFLVPRKIGVVITSKNESFYSSRVKTVVHRKDILSSKTSMLAEKIKQLVPTIKRKTHDDGRLYGAINASEIVDLLSKQSISIAKNQVEFGKSIKTTGTHKITIKLSSKLQPQFILKVVSEK